MQMNNNYLNSSQDQKHEEGVDEKIISSNSSSNVDVGIWLFAKYQEVFDTLPYYAEDDEDLPIGAEVNNNNCSELDSSHNIGEQEQLQQTFNFEDSLDNLDNMMDIENNNNLELTVDNNDDRISLPNRMSAVIAAMHIQRIHRGRRGRMQYGRKMLLYEREKLKERDLRVGGIVRVPSGNSLQRIVSSSGHLKLPASSSSNNASQYMQQQPSTPNMEPVINIPRIALESTKTPVPRRSPPPSPICQTAILPPPSPIPLTLQTSPSDMINAANNNIQLTPVQSLRVLSSNKGGVPSVTDLYNSIQQGISEGDRVTDVLSGSPERLRLVNPLSRKLKQRSEEKKLESLIRTPIAEITVQPAIVLTKDRIDFHSDDGLESKLSPSRRLADKIARNKQGLSCSSNKLKPPQKRVEVILEEKIRSGLELARLTAEEERLEKELEEINRRHMRLLRRREIDTRATDNDFLPHAPAQSKKAARSTIRSGRETNVRLKPLLPAALPVSPVSLAKKEGLPSMNKLKPQLIEHNTHVNQPAVNNKRVSILLPVPVPLNIDQAQALAAAKQSPRYVSPRLFVLPEIAPHSPLMKPSSRPTIRKGVKPMKPSAIMTKFHEANKEQQARSPVALPSNRQRYRTVHH